MMMIPTVISVLGTVPESMERRMEELEIGGGIETIKTSALFRLARILRRVLKS